jgi:hypothetical protein
LHIPVMPQPREKFPAIENKPNSGIQTSYGDGGRKRPI